MRDHVVALGDDKLVFVFQRIRQRADQVEQTVAAGRDVRAVLDIAVRPIAFRGGIVALVEERVEGFENERLVLPRGCLGHERSPVFLGVCGKISERGLCECHAPDCGVGFAALALPQSDPGLMRSG
jgi:hypothetical protein